MKLVATLPTMALVSSAAHALTLPQLPLGASGPSSQHTFNTGTAASYRDRLLALHKSLVEIPSVSGNENEVGQFLVDYLTQHRDFSAQLEFLPKDATSPYDKPRFNVLAWPSRTNSPSPKVLLSSHIDTVPPYIPYSISDDRPGPDTVIRGRGALDAKASVASQIIALIELLDAGEVNDGDVMLLYVVGEETTGDGMRYFSHHLGDLDPPPAFKAGIFGEPTELKLACGHKGMLSCDITAKGQAGHSGYPWLGKSATEVLMRALVKLLDTDLGSTERFGNTTVNVGTIDGGVAANVIPEHAGASMAIRVAVGPQSEGAQIVEDRVREVLKSVDEEAFELSCLSNKYGAVDCDCDVEGFEKISVNYGTDVPNFQGNLMSRYLYGPGTILLAHGPKEAVKVKDLEEAVEGYKKLILHALKSN